MIRISKGVSKLCSIRSIKTLSANCFKSDISLDKLYPASKQQIFTPESPTLNKESFNGHIPLDKLQITYDRSSGPGGQNVNKVSTKVDLRFNVQQAVWISDSVKERLTTEYKNKINRDGFLIIKSDVTRYQQLNLADALEKLRKIIRDTEKPKQIELSSETLEKIRKRQEEAAKQRLIIKRKNSETKKQRSSDF